MKNLLDKLKPEVRKLFNEHLLNYPSSYGELEEELMCNHFVMNLRYCYILNLIGMYDEKVDVYSLFDLD